MSQSSIHDYYAIIKRRPDEMGKDGKLLINPTEQLNNERYESPFKVPKTPVLRSKRSTLINEREIKSESNLNKRSSKTSSEDNQRSILKWTKRTIDFNNESSAEKKKRVECVVDDEDDQQTADQSNEHSNQDSNELPIKLQMSSPTKSAVKKRLFGSELDKIREKILITDETFLNKLKDFKNKTASPVKLELNNLKSPTKRLKEREERREKARALIELSPKKFLKEKLSNSPVKSPIKPRMVDGLTIPSKYKLLIHNFHCLDSVVSMLFNRMETCTFDKIKSGIQKITKKNFNLSHLAQIITVYPHSYTLTYEKKTAVDNLNNLKVLTKQSPFYLVLTPKLNSLKFTPTLLKSRRDEFEDRLNQYVRKLHNDYLLSLDPPVVIADDELTRWHPSFSFPNIPEAQLPEQPTSVNESKSLNDFWAKKLNIEPPTKQKVESKTNLDQPKTKITRGILKGLSQDFVEKIKNKEAANLAKEMTRKPEVDKKITEIKKLPELIRIIHSHFTTEKKKAILLAQVIKKCVDSSTSFSSASCSDLIYLTNELLPDWLMVLKTSQGTFIKINQDIVLKSLYDRLDRCVVKLKES